MGWSDRQHHLHALLEISISELITGLLIAQTLVMTGIAPAFGLSRIQGARAGLLLAAGGEFAFVALCAPLSSSRFQPVLSLLLPYLSMLRISQ